MWALSCDLDHRCDKYYFLDEQRKMRYVKGLVLNKKNELNNINESVLRASCLVPHRRRGKESPVRFFASLREVSNSSFSQPEF
jgi:hypothetical protein